MTRPSTNSVKTGDSTLEEYARLQERLKLAFQNSTAESDCDEYLPDTQIEAIAAWVVSRRLSVCMLIEQNSE